MRSAEDRPRGGRRRGGLGGSGRDRGGARKLRRAIYERTSPGLDVTVDALIFDGVALLVVTVPEGLEVYGPRPGATAGGAASIDCLPMTADDVARLRQERRGDDWSARSARRGGPVQPWSDTPAVNTA